MDRRPGGADDGHRYVPAAGRDVFTRLYDPAIALTMRERTFRGRLLHQVVSRLPPDGSLVDVGCGTGTFAVALASALPAARVLAVDGDPRVLAIARAKPGGSAVAWSTGLADALPLADGTVDAVTLSLVLHHLDPAGKHAALTEAARVLRPGGVLHVADWGRPRDPVMHVAFLALRLLDGFPNTRDHAAGRLPAMIADAGFSQIRVTSRLRTAWGSLEIADATRTGGSRGTSAQPPAL